MRELCSWPNLVLCPCSQNASWLVLVFLLHCYFYIQLLIFCELKCDKWCLLCKTSNSMAKWQNKEELLNLWFMCFTDHGVDKPQCVTCGQVMSTESAKPNKLEQHFEGNHSVLVGERWRFLMRKNNKWSDSDWKLQITGQCAPSNRPP
jgi:hypothetical protein